MAGDHNCGHAPRIDDEAATEARVVQLNELIADLDVAVTHGDDAVDVAGIADDSRRVEPGFAYVVRHAAGATQDALGGDNGAYVDAAIAAGSAAVIDTRAATAARGLGVQSLAGELAARCFGRPAEALRVVGVTGTNGKTTVATLTQHLLNAAGVRCGLIGTIHTDLGDAAGPTEAELTTPGAIGLQAMLATMRDRGLQAAAIEVSSHAIHQGRADAVPLAAAVFTNLSGDHLDYHGTMQRYGDEKARLLDRLADGATAVINADDPWCASLIDRVPAGRRAMVCSMSAETSKPDATVAITGHDAGMSVRLVGPWGEVEAAVPLVGDHNAMNVLQAAAAAWAVGEPRGMTVDGLREGLTTLPVVPGRLEVVHAAEAAGDGPLVLVDYAHTDDALDKALRAVRPIADRRGGRLHVVFGCGGDRDRTKRPRMMRVACEYAGRVVATSDNPRTEDPEAILDEVVAGCVDRPGLAVEREADRAAAIGRAIEQAEARDVVLIAGKGHETYQVLGTERIDFDDREVAAAALEHKGATA
ncbi:MAG: UDP-N-acetylmuramoyl-L-alanyl-D-glutamate--2,6-diaminopimelate ligase [Planctomycetota bacterium]